MESLMIDPQYLQGRFDKSFQDLTLEMIPERFADVLKAILMSRSLGLTLLRHQCQNSNCVRCFFADAFRAYLNNDFELNTEKIRFLFKNWSLDEPLEVVFDKICRKIHAADVTKCKPVCAFHEVYPLIYEKQSCECGAEFSIARNEFRYRISVDVSKIKRKHATDLSYLLYYSPENHKDYPKYSLAKQLFDQLSNVVSKSLNFSQVNHDCMNLIKKTIKLKKSGLKTIFLSFDWSTIQRSSIDSLFALAILKSPWNLSSLFHESETSLKISSIIFENDQNKTLLVTIKDHNWSFHYNSKIIPISSGTPSDLLIFILKHNLFPVLVCYDAAASGFIKWSPSLVSFLEFNCLSREILNNFEDFLMLIEQKHKSYSFDGFSEECTSCQNIKFIGEKCSGCGFIEGDWLCVKCEENNEHMFWNCWKCRGNRIYFDYNYECDECLNISLNTNYCCYCPLSECFLCNKEIFSFEKARCGVCGTFVRSFDHIEGHKLIHLLCINST